MAIQRLSVQNVTVLKNRGKRSEQLVWPRNAPEASVTITRVTMDPGSVSKQHAHSRSEQIWIVECGAGVLLMDNKNQAELRTGDIIRTPPDDTHGIVNTGNEPLVYLAITAPQRTLHRHTRRNSGCNVRYYPESRHCQPRNLLHRTRAASRPRDVCLFLLSFWEPKITVNALVGGGFDGQSRSPSQH